MAMADHSALHLWFEVAGIAIPVLMLLGGIRYVVPWLRRVRAVHETIVGRPASQGVDEIPSVVQRFAKVDTRLSAIEAEFNPNHGNSMRDKIDVLIARSEPADEA